MGVLPSRVALGVPGPSLCKGSGHGAWRSQVAAEEGPPPWSRALPPPIGSLPSPYLSPLISTLPASPVGSFGSCAS